MTKLARVLLAALFAAWLVVPTTGSEGEGGENASGGGVWILPCAMAFSEVSSEPTAQPRDQLNLASVTGDLRLRVASNMGQPTAVLVSDLTSDPIALPTAGAMVTLSRQLLAALQSVKSPCRILVCDASQKGYVIDLTFSQAGVTMSVR